MSRIAPALRLGALGIAGLLSIATSQIEPSLFTSREGPPVTVNDAFPTFDTHVSVTVATANQQQPEVTYTELQVGGSLSWAPDEPGTGGTQVVVRIVPDDPALAVEERQIFVEEGVDSERFTAILGPFEFIDGFSGATLELELGDGPVGELDLDWDVGLRVDFVEQEVADESTLVIVFDDFD